MLCKDCEQILNKQGEKWVLANCRQEDDSFPLWDKLSSRVPDLASADTPTKVYLAERIPAINISALAHFAASIFWRGSIYGWNRNGTVPINLGPFQESFRQYLLGSRLFPEYCSLWIILREKSDYDKLTYTPVQERQGLFRVCRFPMPGFAFSLLVSKNIPLNYRNLCVVHGPGNPVFVTTVIEPLILEPALKMFQQLPLAKRPQLG